MISIKPISSELSNIQLLTLFLGISGVILNTVGLATGSEELNYTSIFLGRLAGLTYIIAVDKFYWWLLTPITISLINSFVQVPELLFLENLVQSVTYQISAYLVFSKLSNK